VFPRWEGLYRHYRKFCYFQRLEPLKQILKTSTKIPKCITKTHKARANLQNPLKERIRVITFLYTIIEPKIMVMAPLVKASYLEKL
jgi:hypothetical protein